MAVKPLLFGGNVLTTINSIQDTNTNIYNWDENNYIYFYHTDVLVILPGYADSVTDSMGAQFSQSTPLTRSAPIFSYSNSGPRSVQVSLTLHRDMITQLNYDNDRLSNAIIQSPEGIDQDYVDFTIKQLQTAVLPVYDASSKMVNPPVIALRLGRDIFIKGVVTSGVGLTYRYPILRNGKYSTVDVSFNVEEVEPYDAESVAVAGSFRGLNETLERRVMQIVKSPSAEKGGK